MTDQPVICTKCGTNNSSNSASCKNCGTALVAVNSANQVTANSEASDAKVADQLFQKGMLLAKKPPEVKAPNPIVRFFKKYAKVFAVTSLLFGVLDLAFTLLILNLWDFSTRSRYYDLSFVFFVALNIAFWATICGAIANGQDGHGKHIAIVTRIGLIVGIIELVLSSFLFTGYFFGVRCSYRLVVEDHR